MTTINLKSSTGGRAASPVVSQGKLSRNEYYMYKKDLESVESAMKMLEDLAEEVAGLAAKFGKRLLMEPTSQINDEVARILSTAVKGFADVHDSLGETSEVMRPFLVSHKPGFLKRLFG
tara:strand:- start:282 stop:638 length:357 start_codon:yes stop_codon:yes gene_type:complete